MGSQKAGDRALESQKFWFYLCHASCPPSLVIVRCISPSPRLSKVAESCSSSLTVMNLPILQPREAQRLDLCAISQPKPSSGSRFLFPHAPKSQSRKSQSMNRKVRDPKVFLLDIHVCKPGLSIPKGHLVNTDYSACATL